MQEGVQLVGAREWQWRLDGCVQGQAAGWSTAVFREMVAETVTGGAERKKESLGSRENSWAWEGACMRCAALVIDPGSPELRREAREGPREGRGNNVGDGTPCTCYGGTATVN